MGVSTLPGSDMHIGYDLREKDGIEAVGCKDPAVGGTSGTTVCWAPQLWGGVKSPRFM